MGAESKVGVSKPLIVIPLVAIVLYGFYRLNQSIPEFAKSFESFGEELPLSTTLVLNFHEELFLPLGLLTLFAGLASLVPSLSARHQRIAFLYALCSPGVLFISWLLVLGAVYLPIFSLGEA
jgi:type II secretory pathway component PulF